jgi:hypothetical protein
MMKQLSLIILVLTLSFSSLLAQKGNMKSIFNGNNLEGWVIPENNIWWSAEDGILSVKSGPEKLGSILWTEKDYTDFIVQTEFKFGSGIIDSGIFLRAANTQIQIGISGSLKRDMTCSPYIPGKAYPVEAKGIPDLLKMDEWNTIKVKLVGNDITAWLNGKKVMKYTAESMAEKGPIGLQLHPKNEMAIDFRNIQVKAL